ncbi:MAG TPA: TonB family protein [Vicinamibacteria bacterium]|nr:TonB family protein [Vicinamibacteria bacterium]
MKAERFARALGLTIWVAVTAPPAFPQAAPATEEPRAAGTEVPVPKRSRFVQPEYPPDALAQGLRGIVILALTIDTAGKVSAVDVVRSLPPFDAAATAAARQWEYEVTRVDGRPVPVRLTVPITFALKLPEMTRDSGIPELRQGVAPPFPLDAPSDQPATVTADLTIDPSGQVVEAEIKSGASPWSEALLAALRTWRFTPTGGDRMLSFQVRAEFVASGRRPPRVDLRLSDPRPRDAAPAVAEEQPSQPPAAGAPAEVESAPAAQAASAPAATPTAPPASAPSAPVPPLEAPSAPAPSGPAPSGPAPSAAEPSAAEPPVVAPPATAPSAPVPSAAAPPAAAPASAAPESPSAPAAGQEAGEAPPPPVEIIPIAPEPPRPVEPGVSAVQDVLLGPGVPDLSKGRRPVVPPIARMNSVSGNVEVRFVVEASGASSVRDVDGPELLREAARQTVGSWMFRRTTPERLPLVAVLAYMGDVASASVKVAP